MWFQLTLFLIGAVRIGHTCGVYTYNHDNRCCDMCPPGTHVGQHCDERTVTLCVTCEENTFQKNWNNDSKCKPCRQELCEGPRNLVPLCSPREDNQCRCNIANTYWDDNVLSCIPCPSCSQGEYPKAPCTGDPQCTKCPDNYFSDKEENFNLTCTKCTSCLKYESKCSSMQNAVCVDVVEHESTTETPPKTTTLEPFIVTTKKNSKNNDAPASALNKNHYWIIAVFSLLVCILFFGAAVYYRKHKNRCQPRRGPSRFFAIQPSRYRQLNTGQLLRDQSASFQFELHYLLNPNGPRNWKALAAVLNFTPTEIANFAVEREKSAENMLDSWKTANIATVDVLHGALLSIGREDIAEYVYNSISEQETDV